MRRPFAASVLGAIGLGMVIVATHAETPNAAPAQASIAFANHDGIYSWQADGTRGLWVQDRSRQWYYADLMGPCFGLNFAETLGFVTEPSGALDQHSAVLFKEHSGRDTRCQFSTFARSAGPPVKSKQKHAIEKPAADAK